MNLCNERRALTAGGNCSTSNVVYGAECLKASSYMLDAPTTQFTFDSSTIDQT